MIGRWNHASFIASNPTSCYEYKEETEYLPAGNPRTHSGIEIELTLKIWRIDSWNPDLDFPGRTGCFTPQH